MKNEIRLEELLHRMEGAGDNPDPKDVEAQGIDPREMVSRALGMDVSANKDYRTQDNPKGETKGKGRKKTSAPKAKPKKKTPAKKGKKAKSKAVEKVDPKTIKRREDEEERIQRFREASKRRPPAVKTEGNEIHGFKDNPKGDSYLYWTELHETFGTTDWFLMNRLFLQTLEVQGGQLKDEGDIPRWAQDNISIMNGIGPQDTVEGLLAAQMTATHNAAMGIMGRASGKSSDLGLREMRVANTLMQTFIRQAEYLDKRRRGPVSQRMTVEHVHVHEGGQAIVGPVESGKGAGNTSNASNGSKGTIKGEGGGAS